MNLVNKKCVPCEGGAPPMGMEEIGVYLKQVSSAWSVEGGKKIVREFKFKDFVSAMAFVNRIAQIAEKEQHHPDIKINYNKVSIELSTHAVGGLSENDFILASKIDLI